MSLFTIAVDGGAGRPESGVGEGEAVGLGEGDGAGVGVGLLVAVLTLKDTDADVEAPVESHALINAVCWPEATASNVSILPVLT